MLWPDLKDTHMTRIGILTFHRSVNFGAVLQTWATRELLSEKGFHPEVIDYFPLTGLKKEIKANILTKSPISGLRRINQFNNFCINELHCSRPRFTKSWLRAQLEKYDSVLVGSDTVLEIKEKNGFSGKFPSMYYEVPNINRNAILWAASADASDPQLILKHKNEIKELVEAFKLVGLREKFPVTNNDLKLNYEILPDPTLALTDKQLQHLMEGHTRRPRMNFDSPYLLYTGSQEKIASILKTYCEEKHLIFVAVDRSKYADINLYKNMSPQTWVELHARAKIVCTDRFHGAIFTLLSGGIPIINDIKGNGKPNKRSILANRFNISDMVFSNEQQLDFALRNSENSDYNKKINTEVINQRTKVQVLYENFIEKM